jgi:hypothetical protein
VPRPDNTAQKILVERKDVLKSPPGHPPPATSRRSSASLRPPGSSSRRSPWLRTAWTIGLAGATGIITPGLPKRYRKQLRSINGFDADAARAMTPTLHERGKAMRRNAIHIFSRAVLAAAMFAALPAAMAA